MFSKPAGPALPRRAANSQCWRWVAAAVLLACATVAMPDGAGAQTAPAKPTGFTAIDGHREIGLRWTGPDDSTITKWQYRYKLDADSSYGDWTDMEGSGPDTRRYTVTGLEKDESYDFRIRAVNNTGNGPQSSEKTGETYGFSPNKPTGLQTLPGNGKVTLTWNEPDYISIQGWEYELDKSETWLRMIPSDSSTTTYTIDGLENGTEYTFRIRSYNSFGDSPKSGEASAVPMPAAPGKPAGFQVTPGNRKATLTWSDPDDDTISKWQYSYKTTEGYGSWIDMPGSGADTVRHVVSMLANDTLHTFRIRAVNNVGDGVESDEVSATPVASVPGKPTGLAALTGDGQITLQWVDPLDATIRKWQYAYKTTGDYENWTDMSGSGATTTRHIIGGLVNGTTYTIRIRAVNDVGNGPESGEVPATPLSVPAEPAGFTVTAGDAQVLLEWNDPLNASIAGWQYSWKTTGDYGAWTDISGSGAQTTEYAVTGLANGVEHVFRIRAVNGSGNGAESEGIAATPRPVPAKPAGLRTEAGNRQARLLWTDPGDSSITGWQYSFKTTGDYGAWTEISGSHAATVRYTVTGLTNNMLHTFRIRAVNGSGAGAGSDEASATPREEPPAKPTGFGAEAGDGEVVLTWDDPDDSSIQGWQYRSGEASGVYGQHPINIPDSGAKTVRHVVTGLENGRTYFFELRAVNAANGEWSDERSATPRSLRPAAPTGLEAAAGDASVALTWDGPDDATITGWQYAVKTAASFGAWMDISGSDAATTAYTATGLDNGEKHVFKLRALNGHGAGAESEEVSATPIAVPVKPADFTATARDGRVSLSWTDPGDATISGWEYAVKATGAYGPWTGIPGSNAETTAHTVIPLDNGTPYAFKVRAVNASGNGAESDEATATPLAVPAKPAGFTATARDGQVLLTWTDPGDATITGWQYAVKATGAYGPWTSVPGSGAGTTAHTVTPLDNGTSYAFKVRAVNASGNGTESDEATATPLPVPAKPTGFEATPGDGAVALSWDDPGDATISGWEYAVKTTGAYGPWTGIPGSSAETTAHTVTPLDNGTPYAFKVRAVNASGNGAASDEATAVPVPVPAKPAGFAATAGAGEVVLSWDDPDDPSITGWEYNQRRGEGEFEEDWTHIPNSHAATTNYRVISLETGATYGFKVRAVAGGLAGAESDEETVTVTLPPVPARPTGFTATPGDREVALAWDHPGDPSIAGWQYRYRMEDDGFGDWTGIPDSDAGTTGYTVTGLEYGVNYVFKVRAFNAGGNGEESGDATATWLPARPTGFTATAGDGEVLLEWDDPGDPSVTHWEYTQQRDGGEFEEDWTPIGKPTSRSGRLGYLVIGLDGGVAYAFKLRAVNESGAGKESAVAAATPVEVPDRPMNFTATPGDGLAALRWQSPENPVAGWQYRHRIEGGEFGDWTDMPQTADDDGFTGYTVTGLANGVTYFFQVRAVGASGAGPPSETQEVTPQPPLVQPIGLVATPGYGRVVLTWDAVNDPGVHWEAIWWMNSSRCAEKSGDWRDVGDAATTRYVVEALEGGVEYCFRLRLARGEDPGLGSDPVSATPKEAAKPAERRTVRAVLAGLAGHVAVGANAVIGARFSAGPAQSRVVLAGQEVPLFARGGEKRMRAPPGGAPKATVRGISGRKLLQDSSLQVALGPPGGEGVPQWSLWHRGDLTRFEGSAGAGSRYGGRLLSAWYGVDMRWDGRWLAGAALARSKAEVDYAAGGGSGLLRTALDSVHPYLQRRFEDGGTVWIALGSGRGTIENDTAGRDIEIADAELATASTGFRAPLPAFRGLKLSASGAAGFARFEADGDAQTAIGSLSASTNRQSLGAEATLEDGDAAYRASLSLRRDGGDGANGIGLELTKGVEAALPSLSGHAAVRTRWLVWNSDGEYREFGVAAAVRRPAGPDGRGLSWSLSVARGTPDGAAGGPESFWREDAPERGGGEDALSLDLSAGWGLVSRWGAFTPRAAFGLAGANDRRLALGLDIGPLSGPRLKLGAERRIPHAGSPESRVTAAVQFRF